MMSAALFGPDAAIDPTFLGRGEMRAELQPAMRDCVARERVQSGWFTASELILGRRLCRMLCAQCLLRRAAGLRVFASEPGCAGEVPRL